jgi:hypothetical protein
VHFSLNGSVKLEQKNWNLVISGCFKDGKTCKLIIREHVKNLQALVSGHEEADTRLLLHALDAS